MRRHLTRSLLALTGSLLAATAMSVRAQALLPGTVAGTRVVPGVKTWVGAQPGGVTVNPDGSREMLIRQTQSRATLNWTQFDVDRGETVRFDQQGNRDWVALNWIHALKPSQIAGRLVADGAVYLINANGIVFKPGSQVDASAFIASTLSIKNDAFSKGLTAMARGQAAFEFDASAGSADARIEVQSGAVRRLDGSVVRAPDGSELVQAATISSADGGRVFLLGTREVINSGLIKSPNGQVILAAGSKVYLFAPTTADSAAFRGLFVEVEAGGANRNLGSVVNNGTIETPLGNTTLMGMALRNAGRISADTSATANGSVYLYSRANPVFTTGSSDRPLTTTSGTVQIAPTGVIEAPVRSNLAADGKPETVLDAQTVYPSDIRLAGQSIQLQGDGASGARLTAQGGLVSLSANENFADASPIKPVGTGRIVIDAGASIDVSGIRGVSVPVSRNLIDVQVGGENVADNPTLRTGPLAQQTLKVDARVGSPLFTQSALDALAATQIKRTVEERMTAGGTVSLSSTGEAVVNPGARINIAGGSVDYAPGVLQTSRLFDGRRIVDVSQATPDRIWTLADFYVENDPRWGVTRKFALSPVAPRSAGYLDGRNAGQLGLAAPWVSFGGRVDGSVLSGERQRTSPPLGGLISFGQRDAYQNPRLDYQLRSPIVLGSTGGAGQAPAFGIDANRDERFGTEAAPLAQTINVPALTATGISRLEVFSNNSVTVPAASPVTLPAGGRLTVAAGAVSVNADISVPAARAETFVRTATPSVTSSGIDLTASQTSAGQSVSTGAVSIRNARIDASGQWAVDTRQPGGLEQPAYLVNAGSVRLQGYRSFVADAASQIDVSAGAYLSPTRRLSTGAAGSVQIGLNTTDSLRDPSIALTAQFDATIRGFGFASGASFRARAADVLVSEVRPADYQGLWLQAGRFAAEGLSSVDLTGIFSASIGADTAIRLVPQSYRFAQGAQSVTTPDALRASVATLELPIQDRKPTSFSMRSTATYAGVIEVGRGSRIEVAPAGSISMDASYQLLLAGALTAPAGTVSLSVNNTDNYVGFRGEQGLYMTDAASIDASGIDATVALPLNRRGGSVLAGGAVSLNAPTGYLVMEPGSSVSARGASGLINGDSVNPSQPAAPQQIATAGGRISLTSVNGGVIASRIDVSAGGSGAAAGSVTIAQTREAPTGASDSNIGPRPARVERLSIVADANAMPAGLRAGGNVDLALNAGVVAGQEIFETRVAQSTLETLDANTLKLSARDQLNAAVDTTLGANRQITLDTPVIRTEPGKTLTVRAPYAELGWTNAFPLTQPLGQAQGASGGSGRLDVSTALALDLVGNLMLQGIGQTRMASDGDLRLRGLYTPKGNGSPADYAVGRLDASGRVDLVAQQIFPVTGAAYTVAVAGADSTLSTARPQTSNGSASPAVPLSGLGKLSLSADTIELNGIQRAPFGVIEVNAGKTLVLGAGAEVSVSGGNTLVPYGLTQDGRQIVYPFLGGTGSGPTLTQLDPTIRLSSPSIDLRQGALIDASGGGDLLATAFIAGSGGSVNPLLRPNVFAIVPSLAGVMPFDYQMQAELPTLGGTATLSSFRGALPSGAITTSKPKLAVGDQIFLNAGSGLAQGVYTLLPASYALLPNAYAIAITDNQSFVPIRSGTLTDGSSVVAAQRLAAGTADRDARWSTVNVLNGPQLRRYGEFISDQASRDLASKPAASASARLPQDGGTLAIDARGTAVTLASQIRLAPGQTLARTADGTAYTSEGTVTGRRGAFEFSSEGATIRIGGTTTGTPAAGVITLDAARLSELDAERVMIGARRTAGTEVDLLTPTAARVSVETGSQLRAEEIVLAAREQVDIGSNAKLVGVASDRAAPAYAVQDPGAVLVVSGTDPTLARTGGQTSTATIRFAPGSAVQARTVLADAPGGVALDPSLALDVKSLELSSRTLVLGDGAVTGLANSSGGAGGVTRLGSSQLASISTGERLALSATDVVYLTDGLKLGSAGFGEIELRAPTLNWGEPTRAGNASIDAQRVILSGGPTLASTPTPPAANAGLGQLRITASNGALPDSGQLITDTGVRTIQGFAGTQARADSAWLLKGDGATRTAGELIVRTPAVIAAAGATQSVFADRLQVLGAGTPAAIGAVAPLPGPGGRLTFSAQTATLDTAIRLPSGRLSIESTAADAGSPSLTLGASSAVDLRSATLSLYDATFAASGGTLTLTSRLGSILAQAGSRIDVSGREGADAGSLKLAAAAGTVAMQGQLAGTGPSGQGGRFTADARGFADAGALAASLKAGGFDGEVSMRQRSGDLVLGAGLGAQTSVIAARNIALAADAGSVRLAGGRLDASGNDGGTVALNASSQVQLASGTTVAARGATGKGGDVTLSGLGGVLAGGATVDVSGANEGGEVELRFARTAANATNLQASANTFQGAARLNLTGVASYTPTVTSNNTTVTQTSLATAFTEATTFANTAPQVLALVGQTGNANARVRPEIEVLAKGTTNSANLTVGSAINLSAIRYTTATSRDTAGVLSLRAGGDLILNGASATPGTAVTAVINDGFVAGTDFTNRPAASTDLGAAFDATAKDTWSYRLTAGSDFGAAQPLSVLALTNPALGSSAGNVRLLNFRIIRTGTGNIDLAAARDILIGTSSATATTLATGGRASIMTAGRRAAAVPGFIDPQTLVGVPNTPIQGDPKTNFNEGGGSITLAAGRSIVSTIEDPLISGWLFRQGQVDAQGLPADQGQASALGLSPAWWPRFDFFRQTVGALGGGNLTLTAGLDITDVSASIGSSGRTVLTGDPLLDKLVVNGGGNLLARADGSIRSGTYGVMLGNAQLVAGDSVVQSTLARQSTLAALGDATLSVEARNGLAFDQVYNPTLSEQRATNARVIGTNNRSFFSTYTERSAIELTAAAGKVSLQESLPTTLRTGTVTGETAVGIDQTDLQRVTSMRPPTLAVAALGGDIEIVGRPPAGTNAATGAATLLAPAPIGGITLGAAGSVTGVGSLVQLDTDPLRSFSLSRPGVLQSSKIVTYDGVSAFDELTVGRLVPTSSAPPLAHAQYLVHLADPQVSRVYAGQDITTLSSILNSPLATVSSERLRLVFAEPAKVRAGRNVSDVSLIIQNLRDGDLTQITAGRDLINRTQTINGKLAENRAGIVVSGPGLVELNAGRDIAMGTSVGIVSRGNLDNTALSDVGASLTLVAGLPDNPAYADFLARYVAPSTSQSRSRDYTPLLVDFVRSTLSGDAAQSVDAANAWALFGSLPAHERDAFARAVFYAELKAAGRNASATQINGQTNPDYGNFQAAYDVMSTLFPKDGAGNIDLVFSQVKTERGGKIEFLVPGVVCRGNWTACQPTAASNAVGNLQVGLANPPSELASVKNSSRLGIFTLGGGDVDIALGSNAAVNRSRVLTAGGGGITMFSALGNIDAGRGSRTAATAPPPLVRVDANGNIVVELQGVVEGSGIGVLVTKPGVPASDVDLFAPKGFIDAGEAGIRSAGNLTLFATEIRNSVNISVGGSATGVPTATVSPNLSLAAAGNTTAAAAASADQAAATDRDKRDEENRQARSRLVVIEFLGFGEDGEEAFRRRKTSK